MFFKKTESFLGIDIGAGGIKLVELRKEKNRPVLYTYGFTRQPQDIHRLLEKSQLKQDFSIPAQNMYSSKKEAKQDQIFQIEESQIKTFADMLNRICSESGVSSRVAVASLPVSSVFHAVVTLPVVKKEDLDRILKAEVKKLLPYPLEQMALEYEVVPGGADKVYHEQRVLVNAAPRALVVFYTEVFRRAGLQLESLEPESIALTRALIGRDTATTMLVDIGSERTNFFIIEQAFPITHHSIELGGEKINQIINSVLGVDQDMVNRVKKDLFSHMLETSEDHGMSKDDFLKMFNQVIEPIIKEIEYSLDLFLRQSSNVGKKPEKIILSGGSAFLPYLTEKISEKFDIKCYIGDPWGRVVYKEGLKPALRNVAPRLAVAVGLALRNVV